MKVIAFINTTTGLVDHLTIPGDPDQYRSGQTIGNLLVREIETNTPMTAIMNTWHWTGAEFAVHEPRSDEFSVWDSAAFCWIEPDNYLDLVKAKPIKEISRLRLEKSNELILYDGAAYDADRIARENINTKIIEVTAKISLNIEVTNKMWRDADNNMREWWPWETNTNYLEWLQGLAIAISERNTLLYTISWAKKAEIESLTTATDVNAYDIHSGW